MENAVPHPGYTTSKPLIAPISSMYKELGAQDACIQLQELSTNYLEKSATAMNAKVSDFLKLLYVANGIPHGTYSFAQMRSTACASYLIVTHSLFEKMVKGCIRHYRASHHQMDAQWVASVGGEQIPPLRRLAHNLTEPQRKQLTTPPEYRLLEYYRLVRVAGTHPTYKTREKAEKAFSSLTASDLAHLSQYPLLSGAPNPPDAINFEDFKLYTRAIKYYSNLLNEICG